MLVLIADDEQPIATVVAGLVEDMGYTPQIASDGKQALQMARSSWPALLLTDLMMPGLNGIELIEAIRAEAAANNLPQIPTILMTAAGLARGQSAQADAYIAKPFDLDELESLFRTLLERDRDHG